MENGGFQICYVCSVPLPESSKRRFLKWNTSLKVAGFIKINRGTNTVLAIISYYYVIIKSSVLIGHHTFQDL